MFSIFISVDLIAFAIGSESATVYVPRNNSYNVDFVAYLIKE